MAVVPTPRPGDSDELLRGREYLRTLRKALVRVRDLTSDLIEPHGLTGPQMLALLWIRDCEGLTQAELASELDSDPNTVSSMLRRMVAKGLVVRARDPDDTRAFRLSPTERGRALMEEAQTDVDRLSLHLFRLMDDRQDEAVMAWLTSVARTRHLP